MRTASILARAASLVAVLSALAASAQNPREFHRLRAPAGAVIVEFLDAAPETHERFRRDLASLAYSTSGISAQSIPSVRREYSIVFHGVALHASREMLSAIETLPYVRAIHPDEPVRALSAGNAPPARRSLDFRRTATRGEGITVAVIDTGIDYDHPALGSGFGPGFKVAGGHDFVNGDDDPRDDHGHGTHVAGIIAADSAEMTGVAAGVTLLAYKVLDAEGYGQQSDVIAALERAVDPNGDGDLSDRADIVNLSLGGMGTPDDPQSLAVDAVVAAGVIVCVAAGNQGDWFAILSPGTARTAITVGAADGSRVASFSSRGPSVKLASVKPDVLAPGVNIRSTFPGGGFETKEGTSMATPHVAGTCALLRAMHAEWTPEQIKAVITSTAVPIEAEVMTQGAGVLDIFAATNTTLLATGSHFDFGLDPEQRGTWRRARSVTVTNAGDAPAALIVDATPDEGVVLRVTPSAFELAPGAAKTITLSISIESEELPSNPWPYLRGGSVNVSGSEVSVHFPWSVVTASRALSSVEQEYGSFHILSPSTTHQPLWLSPNTAEAYVNAGTYEIVAVGYDWNNLPARVSFVYASKRIEGDAGIHFSRADAPHTISLRGTDECGLPLATSGPYLGRVRIYTPPSSRLRGFDLLTGDGVLSVSELHAGFVLKASETGIDLSTNRIVTLQYRCLTGISREVTLAAGPFELKRQRMRFVFASAARRQIVVHSVAGEASSQLNPFASAVVGVFDVAGSVWQGDLYANEEESDGHFVLTSLHALESGRAADVVTSGMRVRNGRFVASDAAEPSPLLYTAADGELVTYGDGPVLIAPHLLLSSTSLHTCMHIYGATGDARPKALEDGVIAVYDREGHLLVQRHADSIDTTPAPGARQHVEFVTRGLTTNRQPMSATLALDVDGTRSDTTPPAFTSIAIVDAAARMTSTLQRGEAGALLFTAADYDAGGGHHPVAGNATRAWCRRHGDAQWSPLTAVEIGDDCGRVAAPLGIQYRIDLTTHHHGFVDLRLSIEDAAGNITTLTLEPAFAVVSPPGRQRAVRH